MNILLNMKDEQAAQVIADHLAAEIDESHDFIDNLGGTIRDLSDTIRMALQKFSPQIQADVSGPADQPRTSV